ncbi:TetR family transcriptional regulator [Enterococcus sp. HY326]|uniref:TetR family transcriptional regulator n=1 Tax=Enterococcus sp. HY326 TaxID=2971265 RepID=UPI00224084DD|nr:TetR family transcriptional regulator [Enterococcus sp. HY326]
MPKTTFFNLSKEKQERIFKAAVGVFSNTPLREAKVSEIIKQADISRGAFYKYFENVDDLFQWTYQQIKVDAHNLIFTALENTKGDLFLALEMFFLDFLKSVDSSHYQGYFKVMMLNGEVELDQQVLATPPNGETQEVGIQKQFFTLINTRDLKLTNGREYQELVNFIMDIMHQLIKQHLIMHQPSEKTKAQFRQRLLWIENGVKK